MTQSLSGRGPALSWPLGPIAHRGLHDAASGRIENTASAFAAAIERGYAIECDVQAALGNQPVVFHDVELDRLTGETGLVADRTPQQLAAIPLEATGDRIPTLAQLLEQVQGRVPLVIEIKTLFGPPGAFEEAIARELQGYAGPLAVMSFDHAAMVRMGELLPEVPRGLISYRWDDDWMPQVPASERAKLRDLAYHEAVRPSFIAYHIDDLPEAAPLELTARLGIPLLAWTVRTLEQRAAAARFADAIIFEGFEP